MMWRDKVATWMFAQDHVDSMCCDDIDWRGCDVDWMPCDCRSKGSGLDVLC